MTIKVGLLVSYGSSNSQVVTRDSPAISQDNGVGHKILWSAAWQKLRSIKFVSFKALTIIVIFIKEME